MAEDQQAVRPPVFIIDDDVDLLGALDGLLTAEGWTVETFDSIPGFLGRIRPSDAGLLLLDVEFPGASGIELQTRLAELGDFRPILFMTGHEQVSTAVDAMKGGAVDFLIKPFREAALFAALSQGAEREGDRLRALTEHQNLAERLGSLTPRERQVMRHVMTGKLNKQVAGEMSLAEITVKVHRANMMQKLRVNSVAELVRLYDRMPG